MSKTEPDDKEAKAGPGFVARTELRLTDGAIRFLEKIRSHLVGEGEAADDRRTPPTAEESEKAPKAPMSWWSRLAIGALLIVIGVASGGYLAYRGLSAQLHEHSAVVEGLRDELTAAHKEETRNLKLLDKFQHENAAYKLEARTAQRQAEEAESRAQAAEKQLEQMKQAAQAERETRSAPAPRSVRSAPPKTGKCSAGSAEELSNCIENFNR